MGLVKAAKDGSEFPTMSDSIPTRYKAVVRFLEGLEGTEATDAFHAWKDILKFHGDVANSKQEDLAAVIGLLKTPRTLIDTYILQKPADTNDALSETSSEGVHDLFRIFKEDEKKKQLPTMEEALMGTRKTK
jgi:hypothetical protein